MKTLRTILIFADTFFCFFGTQNTYLYPTAEDDILDYPFKKPHLWKTRFGFKTSWLLACIVIK